jgi:hypothetical protein
VVDLGIAHFGEPPSVTAYAGKKEIAQLATDEVPRQIENVRMIGTSIDRVVITSPDEESLVNYVRSHPKEQRARGRQKKRRR